MLLGALRIGSPRGRLGATISRLSEQKMTRVAAAVRFALDLG